MSVPYKPEGFQNVIPYLLVDEVENLMRFAKEVFDATEVECLKLPDGVTVIHAQIRIGDSVIMLGKASEHVPALPSTIYVYVEDTDATYNRALEAGALTVMEPSNMFYGDRNAGVEDGEGVTWWIATHLEDVSSEELARRAAESAQQRQNAEE